MSERINELASQAWQYANDNTRDGDDKHGWVYRDKFAELIIQECINVHEADYGIDIIGDLLKKHFGVEE